MIDHVREQMERRVVEVVGIGYDLSDVFPRDALDPRVVNDVLRIINSEKTQVKVACVKNGGRQNAEENDGGI
jgi:hypothetical protein